MPPISVAVVIPIFREPQVDQALDDLFAHHAPDELILVQAESQSETALDAWWAAHAPRRAGPALQRLAATPGRASQMNAGAARARADVLLFLHVDTRLPSGGLELVRQAVARGALWGRFDVRLSGDRPALRVVETLMNWRSALTGIGTGDQALFVRRDVFRCARAYARIPLMEDIELCARLKCFGRPARLRARVVTSSRRWERDGVARTVLRMWALRGLYALGVSPTRLARWYN